MNNYINCSGYEFIYTLIGSEHFCRGILRDLNCSDHVLLPFPFLNTLNSAISGATIRNVSDVLYNHLASNPCYFVYNVKSLVRRPLDKVLLINFNCNNMFPV